MKSVLSVLLLFMSIHTLKAQHTPAKEIPDFTFYTLQGEEFKKSHLPTNKNIVFLLIDTSCPHCQKETELISRNYSKFADLNLFIVSLDTKEAVGEFMETYAPELNKQPNVRILLDTKPEFIEKFRPEKYPALFVYSPSQKLIKHLGGRKKLKEIQKATHLQLP